MSVIDPPRWMTSKEAADYLGLKEQTLAAWRCAKRYPIPFVRIGRLVKYRVADLDRFIARRTVGAEEMATA